MSFVYPQQFSEILVPIELNEEKVRLSLKLLTKTKKPRFSGIWIMNT
jgi:hypothetical protein